MAGPFNHEQYLRTGKVPGPNVPRPRTPEMQRIYDAATPIEQKQMRDAENSQVLNRVTGSNMAPA